MKIRIIYLITEKRFSQALKELAANPSLLTETALDDPGREGVIHYAASSGNVDFMKHLIGLGGDLDRAAPSSSYDTPLCEAARVGDRAMIDLLLEHGARIDGADESATSPLMDAAKAGMSGCVDSLLKHGASPNRLGLHGYTQRFLPTDFAGWTDSETCRKLIRGAGGRSVTDDYDWKSQSGYPVIVTVSNEIGAVFPLQLATSLDDTSIRVAQVRTKPHSMYVFTDELHACGRTELAFYLESTWGILAEYKDGRSKQSFPVDVLRSLASLVRLGSRRIEEGDVFERSGALLGHLKWPDGVGALMAVNHTVCPSGAPPDTSKASDDKVEILILVPLLVDGAWSKKPAQRMKVLETMRRARMKKVMLADPLSLPTHE